MTSDKINPAFILFYSLLLIGIAIVFFLGQTYEAAHKPFWSDETFGLEQSVRSTGYLQLLTQGARGQGSPSPLDYLALKTVDDIKNQVHYFGLSPDVYFRLWPNAVTALSAILAVFILLADILKNKTEPTIKLLQIFLLSFVPFSYYFNSLVYYYAAEMRPYALWNSLWLIALATSLVSDEKKLRLTLVLVLLAMSATASIFQMGAMLLAFLCINYVQTRSLPRSGLQAFRIFLFPIMIAVYYSLRAGQWNYSGEQGGAWKGFYTLWVHESTVVPFMLLSITLCCVVTKNHNYAVVPLTVLFLYFLGPLIYCLTRLKGFFYVERQYIYYDLTNAVFLMTCIQCLPGLFDKLKGKLLKVSAVVLVLLIASSVTFRPKLVKKYQMNTEHAAAVVADAHTFGVKNENIKK